MVSQRGLIHIDPQTVVKVYSIMSMKVLLFIWLPVKKPHIKVSLMFASWREMVEAAHYCRVIFN